jgi:hypothetical protein
MRELLTERETDNYIDATPTWEFTLTMYARVFADLDSDGRKMALEELARAGRMLDRLAAEQEVENG